MPCKILNRLLLRDSRSLSPGFPGQKDFDPVALGGFGRLLSIELLNSCSIILFAIALTIADLLFVGLNSITPSRTEDNVVPLPFSPSSPPSFWNHPIIFGLCKLTLLLGSNAPEWMQEWSRWEGVLPNGHWPSVDRNLDYRNVSRSPCPGLNALANHGILKSSGENLSFHRIASNISRTYNLSPALSIQLLSAAYPLFTSRGLIDLDSLSTHGLIEHDASLLRPDVNGSTKDDQHKPNQELIEKHFPKPQVKKTKIPNDENSRETLLVNSEDQDKRKGEAKKLKHSDLSMLLKLRRQECRATNPSFHENFLFRFFGSGNCALLMEVFGGDLAEIRSFIGAGIPVENGYRHHFHNHLCPGKNDPSRKGSLLDLVDFEVLPRNRWRPSNLQHPWGLTIFKLIYSTFKIEARTWSTPLHIHACWAWWFLVAGLIYYDRFISSAPESSF